MIKLWKFHGGLRLPGHKREAAEAPLRAAHIPPQLIFPLQQRAGITAKPLVAPGDPVLKGQVLARSEDLLSAPIHASSSGTVRAVEERPAPHPSNLPDLCIVIDTDGRDQALKPPASDDYTRLAPQLLRLKIREAGIVGLGGAAFPTAVKMEPGQHRKIDTLILNGAECEPYISCDDRLLREQSHDVLEGAKILLHILGIERCIIGVEDDMPAAFAALQKALRQPGYETIELASVPARYPTGGEKQLIRVLTGRAVPFNGLPADIGVVVQNVATTAAVYQAVCQGEPLISRIVTVTGEGVHEPQNMRVRIGTPIAELIAQCGGYTDKVERLIMGGPMMGFALASDALPVVKSTNCILAAGRRDVRREEQSMPCIRCGECARACPAHLLPQQLYWHCRSDQLEKAQAYNLTACIECGCCDVVCPSHIPLAQHFRAAKSEIAAKERARRKADLARIRHEARKNRQEREKAEREARARQKKAALAAKISPKKQPAKV